MATISNLAYVHPDAVLADDVIVDAFVYIDRDVVVGPKCHVRPHASILSGARIGSNNTIYEGAIISATPQDFRWKGDDSKVIIGDNNEIREQVIINRSILRDGETKIGNNTFIMAQTHIGHDSEIGSYCVVGNACKIAGDVKIGDHSILSSHALVHEHCHLGDWVLIKGGCRVTGNVPPYTIMAHNPISYFGVNAFMLKRAKMSDEVINDIAKCYRHVYQTTTSIFNALRRIRQDIDVCDEREAILSFIEGHDMKLAGLPKIDND